MDISILRVIRKGKKIKQSDLAKRAGISQTFLSLVENNKRVASIEVIENLCEQLDCELRIIPK